MRHRLHDHPGNTSGQVLRSADPVLLALDERGTFTVELPGSDKDTVPGFNKSGTTTPLTSSAGRALCGWRLAIPS